MKILVVDDYKIGAFVTGRLLEGLGHEVALAYDGASAIETAEKAVPDLILLDINMPEMDGYETCAAMRQSPTLKNAAILALTGLEDSVTEDRIREAGFNDIVIKANDFSDLQEKIERLCQNNAARVENG